MTHPLFLFNTISRLIAYTEPFIFLTFPSRWVLTDSRFNDERIPTEETAAVFFVPFSSSFRARQEKAEELRYVGNGKGKENSTRTSEWAT